MTASLVVRQGCGAYAGYFSSLSRGNVGELEKLAVDDFYFEDPFNQITGCDRIIRMFETMFDQVKDPKFEILSTSWAEEGSVAILKWRFTGDGGRLGEIDFPGMSEITFNDDGLATSHVDYWDSGTHFYAKLPLLKQVINFIKKKMHA